MQWLGFGIRSAMFPGHRPIKHLDCAPSSLSRQIAVSQPSGPNHPIMPRCEAVLLLPIRIPYFALRRKPNQQSFQQRIVAPGLYWFVQPGGPLAFAAWRPPNSQENIHESPSHLLEPRPAHRSCPVLLLDGICCPGTELCPGDERCGDERSFPRRHHRPHPAHRRSAGIQHRGGRQAGAAALTPRPGTGQ